MGAFTFAPGIPDAPADTKLYGRKDEAWSEVPSGGGGGGFPFAHGIVGGVSTLYLGGSFGTQTTVTSVISTAIWAFPIRLTKTRNINAAASVTTVDVAGSVMKVGIYAVNPDTGKPGVLVKAFADIPLTATGAVFSADNFTLPAGDYWAAVQSNTTAARVVGLNPPGYISSTEIAFDASLWAFGVGNSAMQIARYNRAFADMPATLVGVTGDTLQGQNIVPWFRLNS